ncbi:MAG: DUF1016 family protein, partial [Nitrospirae bacterium]
MGKTTIKKRSYSSLITDLASLIEQGRKTVVRYVNTALVTTYWFIGRRIVEYEQGGKERAEYGDVLLERLAKDLSKKFRKGFGRENLRLMRQFYLTYQSPKISQTVSGKLDKENSETMSRNSKTALAIRCYPERFALSWSHYRLLLRFDEP